MPYNTGIFNKKGEELTPEQVMEKLPQVFKVPKVTRVEVVDQKGRSYVNWDKKTQTSISLQDDGKTLKIFIQNG